MVTSSIQAQSVQITTDVPPDWNPTKFKWRAEWLNPATNTYEILWEHDSTEHLPGAAGGTVVFGAPGLKENAQHTFRVAWCNTGGCNCYSDRSAPVSTGDFSNVAPAPPASTVYKVEDTFERPDTHYKCDSNSSALGDGLGPDLVWGDCQLGVGGGPSMASNTQAAEFLPSSGANYKALHATNKHTFAEAQVRVINGPNNLIGGTAHYNFQVKTRDHTVYVENNPVPRSYNAKLVFHARDCHQDPVLTIFRPDEYGQASCDAQSNPILPGSIRIPTPDPNDKCDADPPLSSEVGSTGQTEPLWLRIEVDDVASPDPHPRITATVAWGNCPAGLGIGACEHVCTAIRDDPTDPMDMRYPVEGRADEWGLGFHDKYYHVEIFRAGSE